MLPTALHVLLVRIEAALLDRLSRIVVIVQLGDTASRQ